MQKLDLIMMYILTLWSRLKSWCCGCWVTGSNLRLEMNQPDTNLSYCSEEQDTWVVWHRSHPFSPCMSCFSSTAVHCSFSFSTLLHCCLFILSSLALHASLLAIPLSSMPIQLANCTTITQIKTHKQSSAVLLHFCLSSTSYRLTLSLFQSQLFSL